MLMKSIENDGETGRRNVEILTSTLSKNTIGYRIGGARPGPNIIVSCFSPVAGGVLDRLMSLPTIPWLRGTICLIMVDQLDDQVGPEPLLYGPGERVDEILFLPYHSDLVGEPKAIKDGYWLILRLCARLGMIDGRGVIRDASG